MKTEEYHQLLKDGRWQRRRLEIMQRDDFKCTKCGTTNDLNVHHIRYIAGRKPWEYDDSDLITLCGKCHKKWHEDTKECCELSEALLELVCDEATTCEECAYQSGCKAGGNNIACDKFQFKSCLSCLNFQIKGDESFDGTCTYTGKDIECGGSYCEDCNAEYYSSVVSSNEEWKEYVKQKGWD